MTFQVTFVLPPVLKAFIFILQSMEKIGSVGFLLQYQKWSMGKNCAKLAFSSYSRSMA